MTRASLRHLARSPALAGTLPQAMHERRCFFAPKEKSPCASMVKRGLIPPQLDKLMDALPFCRQKLGEFHAKAPNGSPKINPGIQPGDDCSTRLELGLATPFE